MEKIKWWQKIKWWHVVIVIISLGILAGLIYLELKKEAMVEASQTYSQVESGLESVNYYDDDDGTGTFISGHIRAGHWRTLASGDETWVRECRVKDYERVL